MGTFRAQLSETLRKLEEALDAIYYLTDRIREEIGEETSVPAPRPKEELLSRLFPEGLPTERLKGELERNRAKYEESKTRIRAEIEEVLAKLHRLEAEYDGVEKRCRRIEEIYQDLYGDMEGARVRIEADKAYRDAERVL